MATTIRRRATRVTSEELGGRCSSCSSGADSVELKVDGARDRRSVGDDPALGSTRSRRRSAQVFFFDTPDLALNQAGVVVRARRIQGGRGDTVVKLRPVVPDELPGSCADSAASTSRSMRCPAASSARPRSRAQPAATRSVTAVVAASGRSASCSRRSSERSTPRTRRRLELDDLVAARADRSCSRSVLAAEGARPQAGRRAVALPGRLADPRAVDEVRCRREAFQVAAETRAYLVGHGRRLGGDAADEDEDGARVLRGRVVERRRGG